MTGQGPKLRAARTAGAVYPCPAGAGYDGLT
jgi:hypothetical protein